MVNADVLWKLGEVCARYLDDCTNSYDFETRSDFQEADYLRTKFYSLARQEDSDNKDYEQEVQSILDKRIRGSYREYFIDLEKVILEVLNAETKS